MRNKTAFGDIATILITPLLYHIVRCSTAQVHNNYPMHNKVHFLMMIVALFNDATSYYGQTASAGFSESEQ